MKHIQTFEGFLNESINKDKELNELTLNSAGIQGLLHAIYYNWNDIKDKFKTKFYFKSFKDVIDFIQTGDQEEQGELEAAVKELGIDVIDLDNKNTWSLK